MIWWTSGSFWLLFGLPRITFLNWMFTHVFTWTISCIAIHINSLSLPISKRTMWREKEKDIERRSQRLEHERQPNLRPRQWSYQVWLSNWVLDVCLPRRCWNPRRATKPTKPWVVLVSTVPLPGQTLATGLRCEKKRRVCNFVQRGGCWDEIDEIIGGFGYGYAMYFFFGVWCACCQPWWC